MARNPNIRKIPKSTCSVRNGKVSHNGNDRPGLEMLMHKRIGTQVGTVFPINHSELKMVLCILAYGLVGGSKLVGMDQVLQWIETNPMKRPRLKGVWSGLVNKGYIEQLPGKTQQASWRISISGKQIVREYMKQYWIVRAKLKKSKPEIESLEEYLSD